MPSFNPGNRLIEMRYKNASGEVSRRRVSVNRCHTGWMGNYDLTEGWYFSGFCHLRCEQRTFRSDRILSLWDLKAGGEWIENVAGWFEAPWQEKAWMRNWRSCAAARRRAWTCPRRASSTIK